MSESGTSLPPFIPGLIIVGLLIVISIAIGWRNYAQRRSRQLVPGMGEWPFWDVGGVVDGGGRQEKPKLWEVGLAAREPWEKDGAEWQQIMPLSAMSVAAASPSPIRTSDPELSRLSTPSSPALTSRLTGLNFRSSPPRRPPSHPPPSRSQLQVAVMISMPSSHRPRWQRWHRHNPDANFGKSPAESRGTPAPLADIRSNTTLSNTWNEKMTTDPDEIDDRREVVLGVAVLPWWRDLSNESLEGGGVTVT